MELKKAIKDAIKREQSAYKLYCHLTKKADDVNTQAMFRQLAIQELKHEALFKEFEKTGDIIEARDKVYGMYMDENLNIHDELNPSMGINDLREGFELAMKLEKEAVEIYTALYQESDDDDLKDVFHHLAEEEQGHERILRKEYRRIF